MAAKSRLFLRNTQRGLYSGGKSFSGVLDTSGGSLAAQSNGQVVKSAAPMSGRLERIKQY